MCYELCIYMSDLSPLGCKKLCRDPVYPPVVGSTLFNHSALFKKLRVIPLIIYYQSYITSCVCAHLLFFNLRRQGQLKVLVFCYFLFVCGLSGTMSEFEKLLIFPQSP